MTTIAARMDVNGASLTALLRSPRGALAATSIGVIVAGLLLELAVPAWSSTVWLVAMAHTRTGNPPIPDFGEPPSRASC